MTAKAVLVTGMFQVIIRGVDLEVLLTENQGTVPLYLNNIRVVGGYVSLKLSSEAFYAVSEGLRLDKINRARIKAEAQAMREYAEQITGGKKKPHGKTR